MYWLLSLDIPSPTIIQMTPSPTPQSTTSSPSDSSDTPSNTETQHTEKRNVVLLLNIPYKEVRNQWNEFSAELIRELKGKKITVEDISIAPDTSSTM